MEQTWVTIAASLLMGLGAVGVLVFAVKRGYFQDVEEAKYQVFWSDIEELVSPGPSTSEEKTADGDHLKA